MDTKNNDVKLNDPIDVSEESSEYEISEEGRDELKNAVEETLSRLRIQNMLLGGQSMCKVILNKITAFERKPGSKSNNDHKRLIKDIKQFCETALSRKVNTDGESELIEETVQN